MTSHAELTGKLTLDECWELLEGDTFGQLGLEPWHPGEKAQHIGLLAIRLGGRSSRLHRELRFQP